MNDISSLCSSLASRTLWLHFSPSLFLLWCWAFSGWIHRRSLLFFDVASSGKSAASLPALLGCLFFWGEFMFSYSLALRFLRWISQLCIFLLWHWKSSVRNYHRFLHFVGVSQSATNSTKSAYSSVNSLQGWKCSLALRARPLWNEKIRCWNRVTGFVLRWLFHYRHTNSQITTNSNSFASLTGRHCVPPVN